MARARQMDDFMVGGRRGPSARNRPDPNAGRRPGDPYIIAQDSRPVGGEGLSQNEIQQFQDFLNVSGRGNKIRNRLPTFQGARETNWRVCSLTSSVTFNAVVTTRPL